VTSPNLRDPKHLAGFGARAENTTPEGRLPVTPERYASFLVRFVAERRRILLSIPKSPRAASMAPKEGAARNVAPAASQRILMNVRKTSNQSMKPTAPLRENFNELVTDPARGLSLSR
jgi:hypothetical protein